jgi:HAD superfamily hydrolase (TIGR01549 family)
MGVIVDLDLTLIDSQRAEPLRKAKRWPDVYKLIPQFVAYDGISGLMTELVELGIPVCVVTSSPRPYCVRVLEHFKWQGVQTVCYHDTQRHKPYPDPILIGLQRLGIQADEAISVGDDPKDIAAAKAAHVYSIGALWGTLDRQSLINSNPDVLCETVEELRRTILTRQ